MWQGVLWSLIEQNRSVKTCLCWPGARGGGRLFAVGVVVVSRAVGEGRILLSPCRWTLQSGSNHSSHGITGGLLATVCLRSSATSCGIAGGPLVHWPKWGGVSPCDCLPHTPLHPMNQSLKLGSLAGRYLQDSPLPAHHTARDRCLHLVFRLAASEALVRRPVRRSDLLGHSGGLWLSKTSNPPCLSSPSYPLILLCHQESPLRHTARPSDSHSFSLPFSFLFSVPGFPSSLRLWPWQLSQAQALGQRNGGWVYARNVKQNLL